MTILSNTACWLQIRAQLGAMGLPLLGDTMYEALAARTARSQHDSRSHNSTSCAVSVDGLRHPETGADSLGMTEQSNSAEAQQPDTAFSAANRWLNEPGMEGIGLQACKLVITSEADLMGSSPATFEAKIPWWREPEER